MTPDFDGPPPVIERPRPGVLPPPEPGESFVLERPGRAGITPPPAAASLEAPSPRELRRPEEAAAAAAGARRGAGYGLPLAALGLLLLGGALTVDWVIGLWQSAPLLGAVAGIGLVLVSLAALRAIWAEIAGLASLASVESLRLSLDPLDLPTDPGLMSARLEKAAARIETLPGCAPAVARWRREQSRSLSGPMALSHFSQTVLAERDAAALALVRAAVRDSFALVALSPSPLTDGLLFTWRAARLLRRIAALYGLRPGRLGLWRLTRQILTDLGTLTAADLLGDAVTQLFGERVLARVSTAAGEGTLAGWRMARLGLAMIERCRPVPFTEAERPGLAAVRPRLGGLL